MEEIDYSEIKLKEAPNFAPVYKKMVVESDTMTFLQDYSSLIYENDFPKLFRYHAEKQRTEILSRVCVYYKDIEKKEVQC
ncbi:hypothetical protein [uncultured Treponema sp.]|uniref:hypothetical protein n=1 Tax=uncultured Treponema sp. TaxID=162155 RepID=UPI00258F3427|nr:hypothetical protein [uncultured Treponema sp.]